MLELRRLALQSKFPVFVYSICEPRVEALVKRNDPHALETLGMFKGFPPSFINAALADGRIGLKQYEDGKVFVAKTNEDLRTIGSNSFNRVREDALFRGIDPRNLALVLQTGTDKNRANMHGSDIRKAEAYGVDPEHFTYLSTDPARPWNKHAVRFNPSVLVLYKKGNFTYQNVYEYTLNPGEDMLDSVLSVIMTTFKHQS